MSSRNFRLIEYASIGILAYIHHVNAKRGTGYSWKELFTPEPNVSILLHPPTGVMLIVMALTLVGCWTIFKNIESEKPRLDYVQYIKKELALITCQDIKIMLKIILLTTIVMILGVSIIWHASN